MRKIITTFTVLIISLSLSSQTVSTIQKELETPWCGFGYNQWGFARESDGVTFRPWDDDLWKMTKERILAIQPALVRLPLMREWFNKDDAGNNLPIGTYNWNSKYMQAFYKIMDLYKENDIAVLSGLWHSAYDPLGREPVDFYVTKGNDSFARLQGDLIDYLINTKGYTNIIFYTPTNEPLGSISDFNVWKTMMKNLHEELSDRSLPTNILIGADSWGDWTWLPARENKNELIGYDFHNYLNDTPDDTFTLLYERTLEQNLKNTLARIYREDNTNKPVMITEIAPIGVPYIDWPVETAPAHCRIDTYEYGLNFVEYGIQLMRSGIASGLAWGLDGFEQNKNAGMWNNAGTYGGMRLRPWYYTWQLMCRYFPANATILEMSEAGNSNDIRIAGAKINTDDYTFAVTNRRTSANSDTRQVTIKAAGNAKTFYVYLYSREYYGDGVDLSLPYQSIQTNNLANEGITIEVPLEAAVILTTLPPLSLAAKPDALKEIIDFETTSGYLISADKNNGLVSQRASNPRKREPNISETACSISQSMPSDGVYNPNDAYVIIGLDSLFQLTQEKKFLSFQVYRNGADIDFTVGVKLNGIDGIYAADFSSVSRTWQDYQLDLSALTGHKIETYYIFPNNNFLENNSGTTEYIYFDNFSLTNSGNDAKVATKLERSEVSFLTSVCDFTFEHKNISVLPETDDCGSVLITSNPTKQTENSSDKACRITYTASSGCDLTSFYASLNPYPNIFISSQKPYLNFQVLRSVDISDITLKIKLKNGNEVSRTFSLDKRRTWRTFTVDLSAYAGEIIENIHFYPNTNNPASQSDDCYIDNILLSNEILGTTNLAVINDDIRNYYIKDNQLNIIGAEQEDLQICSIDGKLIFSGTIDASVYQMQIPPGIFIMGINDKYYKLIN